MSATLTALVNDVARARERAPETHWIVVLDDYHAIGVRDVHEASLFLLDHSPLEYTWSWRPAPTRLFRWRCSAVAGSSLRFAPLTSASPEPRHGTS